METASGGAAGSSGGTPAAFKTEIERRVDKLEERVGRLEPKAVPDPRAMPPEIRKYIERQAEVATSTADKIAQRIIDADERADAAVAQAVAQANADSRVLVDVRTAWRRDLDKGRAALASMTADRDDLSLRLTLANGDLATVLAALAGARADCISIGREATDFSTRLNHVWAALEKQGFRPSTQVPQPDLAAFVMSTIESLRQDAVRATDKLRSAHAEVSSRDAEVKRLRARLAEGRKIAEEYLAQHAICGEEDEGMGCPCGDCDAARAWLGRPSKPGEATSPRGSVTAALGVLRYLAAKDCTSRDMHVRAATCIEAKIAKPWCEHCTARSAVDALDASAGGTTVVRANRVPDAGAECSDNPPVGVALPATTPPRSIPPPQCGCGHQRRDHSVGGLACTVATCGCTLFSTAPRRTVEEDLREALDDAAASLETVARWGTKGSPNHGSTASLRSWAKSRARAARSALDPAEDPEPKPADCPECGHQAPGHFGRCLSACPPMVKR